MPPHLTAQECDKIDRIVRFQKNTAAAALTAINADRRRKEVEPIQYSSVCKYVRGRTHRRNKHERRGKKRKLSKKDVNHLLKTRRKLIQEADNEYPVYYCDVVEAAQLEQEVSQRTVEKELRAKGVKFEHPRKKVYISEDDAKERKQWVKDRKDYPPSYWTRRVHAFIDTKSWLVPITPEQKKKFRATRIKGHLRLKSEGCDRGFVKPAVDHMSLGIPSIKVSAAVSNDRVILWHVTDGNWRGESAKEVYEVLAKTLKRRFPKRSSWTVVEDGDLKGWQSGLGLTAKATLKLNAETLPPRSPSLMPLDYAIWSEVSKRMAQWDRENPDTVESKEEFKARLRKTALNLPRPWVKQAVLRMKKNCQGIWKANGFHAKND